MQKKQKTLLLIVTALFSAVVAGVVAGFFIYIKSRDLPGAYASPVTLLSRISFVLRNIVSCFAFSPNLSITDILGQMKMVEGIGLSSCQEKTYYVFTALYAFVIFLAPICTASAFYIFFIDAIRSFWWTVTAPFRSKPSEVVILVGDGKAANSIIEHELEIKNNREIIFITNHEYTREQKISFLKNKISVIKVNLSESTDEVFKKTISKAVRRKINGIILCEDSSVSNFTLYMKLMTLCRNSFSDDLLCCCRCGENSVRQLFEEFYMRTEKCIPPKFFSVSEMRVYSILEHMPIPIGKNGEVTNILIGGFNVVGQRMLYDSVIMATSSGSNEIHIDVVDIEIETRKEAFIKNLAPDVFDFNESRDNYEVKPEFADGKLSITFHKMDVSSEKFESLLSSKEYDYVSLFIEDVEVCSKCLLEMDRIRNTQSKKFKISISFMSDPEIALYLQKGYDPVYISGTRQFLNADNILHRTLEDSAKKFHETYRSLSLCSKDTYAGKEINPAKLQSWLELPVFKQIDNRFVSRHQEIKKELLERAYPENSMKALDNYFGVYGSIFQIRGNTYLYSDPVELIQKINADPFLREMGMIEHRRWCYARIMTGWRYTADKSNKKINDQLKRTNYLLTWDELCQTDPATCFYDFMPLLMLLKEEHIS